MTRKLIAAIALAVAFAATSVAQEPPAQPAAPLPLSSNPSAYVSKPLTFAQQTARYEAEQRVLRIQWNKWIAHDPLRPTMNASYMSNGVNRYYLPSRGVITSVGSSRMWYW